MNTSDEPSRSQSSQRMSHWQFRISLCKFSAICLDVGSCRKWVSIGAWNKSIGAQEFHERCVETKSRSIKWPETEVKIIRQDWFLTEAVNSQLQLNRLLPFRWTRKDMGVESVSRSGYHTQERLTRWHEPLDRMRDISLATDGFSATFSTVMMAILEVWKVFHPWKCLTVSDRTSRRMP